MKVKDTLYEVLKSGPYAVRSAEIKKCEPTVIVENDTKKWISSAHNLLDEKTFNLSYTTAIFISMIGLISLLIIFYTGVIAGKRAATSMQGQNQHYSIRLEEWGLANQQEEIEASKKAVSLQIALSDKGYHDSRLEITKSNDKRTLALYYGKFGSEQEANKILEQLRALRYKVDRSERLGFKDAYLVNLLR